MELAVQNWQPRKRIRLDESVYREPGSVCSITIAVKNRRPVFANHAVAHAAVKVLRDLADRHNVPVHAFCIMPDHVHLLLEPSGTCDIVTFVGQFKNLAQRETWRLGVHGAFWQLSFWDHFLRSDEAVADVAAYVFENPVRAGLVHTAHEHPFSGSLTMEVW